MKLMKWRALCLLFALAAVGASERLADSSLVSGSELALREPATESTLVNSRQHGDWHQHVATVELLDSRGRHLP